LSKVVSTKINTGFLAIVLIIGTFAAISPSFMTSAQAFLMDDNYESNYGMNSYDDKQSYGKDSISYDKSKVNSNVIVKNIECSNTNVNNNGFNEVELDALQPFLNGLATDEAQASDEDEIGASSLGSDAGKPSGSDTDFKVVCINNNIPLEPPVEEPSVEECTEAEANAIEVCFEENMSARDLGLLTNALENGITVETEEGNSVTLNSFADICKALKGITTWEQLFTAVLIITDEFSDPTAPVAISNDLIDCIAEALGIPLPSPPPGG
jgi:hypothetical protein